MRRSGLFYAGLGVLVFSFTLPMVKLGLPGFSPWTMTFGRAAIAGLLALVFLRVARVAVPSRVLWKSIFLTASGIILGWPILTTVALQYTSSAHSAVITSGLPMATAVFAVLRLRERVGWQFWTGAVVGTAALVSYAWWRGGGQGASIGADLMLFGAVLAAAFGYAEGAVLARQMPGWQVVSWCVVAFLPLTLPAAALSLWAGWDTHTITPSALAGFLFTAFGSMYFGFFAWYRGLAELGVARGSQIQLLQPLLTLAWSALLLGETVTVGTLAAAGVVLVAVAITQRARLKPRPSTQFLAAE